MKKIHQILLLTALLLMPTASLHAQIELSYTMRTAIEELPDSMRYDAFMQALQVEAERYDPKKQHLEEWMENFAPIISMLLVGVFALVGVILFLKDSRRREETRSAIINKMIDSGVFTSANADTAEIIRTLTSKKSDKDRVIFSASILGLGIGLIVFHLIEPSTVEFVPLAGCILAGYGGLSLVARAALNDIQRRQEKKKVEG